MTCISLCFKRLRIRTKLWTRPQPPHSLPAPPPYRKLWAQPRHPLLLPPDHPPRLHLQWERHLHLSPPSRRLQLQPLLPRQQTCLRLPPLSNTRPHMFPVLLIVSSPPRPPVSLLAFQPPLSPQAPPFPLSRSWNHPLAQHAPCWTVNIPYSAHSFTGFYCHRLANRILHEKRAPKDEVRNDINTFISFTVDFIK